MKMIDSVIFVGIFGLWNLTGDPFLVKMKQIETNHHLFSF